MPEDYGQWLNELKTRIHSARQRAMRAVNREMDIWLAQFEVNL